MLELTERFTTKAAVLALAAGFFATSASAVVTYPGPFAGVDVTYTDVEESSADPANDPEPLYGAPAILPANILDFDPSANAFAASSPAPDTTDGTLRFMIASNTAAPISTLVVRESGDFAFTGATSNGELVAATLLVHILDATTEAVLLQQQATFSEAYDQTPSEAGNWSNEVSIDLSALGRTEYKVLINNLLQATGTGPATAFIRKKDFQIDVPEPASALLALSGGLMLLRRRQSA